MTIKEIWSARRATPTKAAVWFLAISAATAACESATAPNVPEASPPAPIPVPIQAAEIIKVSGDEQEGRPGDQLQPIIVTVRDPSGKPVAGARVRFSVGAGDGFVTLILVNAGREFLARHIGPADQITNGNGEALALWSLGRHGENTLLAAVQREGEPLQVTFRATSLSSGYAGGSFALTSTVTSVKLYDGWGGGPYNCVVESGSIVLSNDGSFEGKGHFACESGVVFDVIETGFYADAGSTLVLHYQESKGDDPYGFFDSRDVHGVMNEGTIVFNSFGAEWRYTSLD